MTSKTITVKVSFSKKLVSDVSQAYRVVLRERGEVEQDPPERWLREFLRKYAQRDSITQFVEDDIHNYISKDLDQQVWD